MDAPSPPRGLGPRRIALAMALGLALALAWVWLGELFFTGDARSLWPAWVILVPVALGAAWWLGHGGPRRAAVAFGFEVLGVLVAVALWPFVLMAMHEECGPDQSFHWTGDEGLRSEILAATPPDGVRVEQEGDHAIIRWHDGPLDLHARVHGSGRGVLHGNVNGLSERTAQAALEDVLHRLGVSSELEGFTGVVSIC